MKYIYKESGIEWLGKMPEHWVRKRLKDIALLRSGDAIATNLIEETGEYPVFGGNGIRGYAAKWTHEGEYPIIGRQGALCGNVKYASGKFWASEHAVVVAPYGRIERRWLTHLLDTMNLNQYSNGAAQPGLSVDRIKQLYIPLPPPEEQAAIAAYLDNACAKLDRIIGLKGKAAEGSIVHQQTEILKAYRKSLIHECVTGKKQVYGVATKTNKAAVA